MRNDESNGSFESVDSERERFLDFFVVDMKDSSIMSFDIESGVLKYTRELYIYLLNNNNVKEKTHRNNIHAVSKSIP